MCGALNNLTVEEWKRRFVARLILEGIDPHFAQHLFREGYLDWRGGTDVGRMDDEPETRAEQEVLRLWRAKEAARWGR